MNASKLIRHKHCKLAALILGLPVAGMAATVGSFTGGDPGEGLDLQGNFAYAANVGTPGAVGKVGDADFTADNAAGINLAAVNEIPGWTTMNFGDTDNDKRLGQVLNSIRWSPAPSVVTLKLKVEKDIEYKLQLLFSEQCCAGRGFNVVIDGKTEVQNFIPAAIQAGDGDFTENRTKVGAVITHSLKAAAEELLIVLDGAAADAAEINDRNAIFNGFTLERISPITDDDKDGLRDDWEKKFFGDLSAAAADDADQDGLTNAEEQTLGTDPKKADSDGDSLADGAEVKTHKSDPSKKDSDGDGIEDGREVNVLKTDPTKTDSDGDGSGDALEVALGTDPADKNSKPILTNIGVFTGPEPGEGLDLNGNFVYALALGGPEEARVKVRDASFEPLLENEVAGATLQAKNTIANWYQVNYGDSADDAALAAATSSIRWSPAGDPERADVVLTLENLEIGAQYKAQLMFGEACCDRGFDVYIDGQLIVDNFNPGRTHGGINNRTQEALITRIHFARDTKMVVRLDGATAPFSDKNAIFNAFTLEKLAGKTDTDNDNLPDEWEKLYFTSLNETGTGDKDQDGLSNADEFNAGTDPNLADSDRDGASDSEEKTAGTSPLSADTDGDELRDGDEKTSKTNPLKADSDDDGLPDGPEVVTYKTDPLKSDTDGDGKSDGAEVNVGLDPLKADPPTVFSNIVIKEFSGGDPGEGLDLQGNFAYAINLSSDGAAGKAGDADFTSDTATPGFSFSAPNDIPAWDMPEFGDSEADNVIEKVLQGIRWAAAPVKWRLEFGNLIPGSTYKLQLFFYEQCCGGRGFNIIADGEIIAPDFIPANIQGGVNNTAAGALVSVELATQKDKLVVIGDGPGATSPDINDRNAIIDGATLEILKEGPKPAASIKIAEAKLSGAGFAITFNSESGKGYKLEYKESLTGGTWQSVATGNATGATTTLTDTDAGRRSKPTGFYRVSLQ